MDVSGLLASTSKGRSTEVIKDVPLVVDAGLLAVFDTNDIDEERYRSVCHSALKISLTIP
jgi:hypothetical protein